MVVILDGPNFRFLRRIVREESIEPLDNDVQVVVTPCLPVVYHEYTKQ